MNRNRLDNERTTRIVSLDFDGGNAFVLLDDSANDTELADVIRHTRPRACAAEKTTIPPETKGLRDGRAHL